jgi:putative transposase
LSWRQWEEGGRVGDNMTKKMEYKPPLLGGVSVRNLSERFLNKQHRIYSGVLYNACMLNLTYEYKLIPTDTQRQTFDQWLNICRNV